MFRFSAVLAILLAAMFAAPGTQPAHASDPCDAVASDPEPPGGPIEPIWVGTVLDTSTNTGVSGATVRIYVCANGTPAEVDDTTTDSSGDYSFAVSAGAYYYVAADIAGPLSGMSVSSGYSNPTDALGLGSGDSADVDLGFE